MAGWTREAPFSRLHSKSLQSTADTTSSSEQLALFEVLIDLCCMFWITCVVEVYMNFV